MIKSNPEPDMSVCSVSPVILPRAAHCISRQHVDEHALKVLYRLNRQGHLAYLVGGSVRDLLLGRTPKDFDVGTDASPEEVKSLFRNCFLVGRRFRLAHIRFRGNLLVEVASFRRNPSADELPEDGDDHFHFVQNVFGTPREDAFRRDFTINALFYNIDDFSVIDHVGGLKDLEERRLRMIGDPLVRFEEDPVRMLRALEFAARLDFTIDDEIIAAIDQRRQLLSTASSARLREEIMELFRHQVAGQFCELAQRFGLLDQLFGTIPFVPQTIELLKLIDQRTAEGTPIRESIVLAGLTLAAFFERCPTERSLHLNDAVAVADELLRPHCIHYSIAQGIRCEARDLLIGCFRLARGRGMKGDARFLRHPFTPKILELFALWCQIDHSLNDTYASWQVSLDPEVKPDSDEKHRPKRRRRRPRRKAPVPG
ncbi:polynucleotide adenylyltransferase PcnB [Geopsychrobacter electrodiphilus]|uniref:polynucleotide adenylyltransferase PcnB n=1 Tax=Geopsychrobacter electrodiphilus TaxID=225196 RepID=UPI001FE10824|nr:polynucleotide adenylyltransferase PcnB [Geopsychrobacter electrodiphilus]